MPLHIAESAEHAEPGISAGSAGSAPGILAGLAVVHGAALAFAPSAPLIAVGVWWNSNTIAHNFVHRPFFRRRGANAWFGAYLSVLLGIPQALWRQRHLAHHAGIAPRLRPTPELWLHVSLVAALWIVLAISAPMFFATVYAPGYIAGLLLCALHGHYEHTPATTSHYGALYNLLCFNDGYHVEHHRYPGADWSRLRAYRAALRGDARVSAWPAPLRWIELLNPWVLDALERLTLRSPALQRFVLRTHTQAIRPLTASLPRDADVAIVGGGLFPRTAMILQSVLPAARLTIIDANRANLDNARRFLNGRVTFVHARYSGLDEGQRYDLVVIPLAFDGDRRAIYADPPARAVLVHDWNWRAKGTSRIVSVLLGKRLNLVERAGT